MKITCERNYLANAFGYERGAPYPAATRCRFWRTFCLKLKMTVCASPPLTLTPLFAASCQQRSPKTARLRVPAHLLNEVVSKLPDAPVTLEAQDGKVSVRCGKSDYTILNLACRRLSSRARSDGWRGAHAAARHAQRNAAHDDFRRQQGRNPFAFDGRFV